MNVIAKLFDPLGLILPATVKLRMLLQDLCVKKYDWDSIILGQVKTLRIWLDDAETVDHIETQRYYFPTATKRIESVTLHVFGDTSEEAYGTFVYLCVEAEDGYVTSLVDSKIRVAPWTPITLPRHELIAALLLARLVSTVNGQLSGVINIVEGWLGKYSNASGQSFI